MNDRSPKPLLRKSGEILSPVVTDRIEQAKQDWREKRFDPVPQETEFIPLPEEPPRPKEQPM